MTSTQADRIDGLSTSVAVKAPVRVATTANITLSGLQAIDGITVAAGDRVLVKDQTVASENGIYCVSSSAWIRARDFNGNRDVVEGTLLWVANGSANRDTFYQVANSGNITISTTELAFSKVNGAFTGTYQLSAVGSVERSVNEKFADFITATDFDGVLGDGSNDDTAGLQAAIDHLELVGGGTLWLPPLTYKVTQTLTCRANNITVRGTRGAAIVNSETGNTDTFNLGLANPDQNNLITGCSIRDLTIQKIDVNPTDGSHIYVDRGRQCKFDNLNLIGGKYGITFAGVGQGCELNGSMIQPGSTVTSLISGSAGIVLARRQVDASDPNAVQDAADSLYYTEPNSVHISNTEVFGTQYWSHGLLIHAADGLYATNCYFGQTAVAPLTISALQANLSLSQLSFGNCFFDPAAAFGDYAAYYINSGLSSAIVSRHDFNGCKFSGGQSDALRMNETKAVRLTFNACDFNNAQENGCNIIGGEDIEFNGCNWDSNNLGAGNDSNVVVLDTNGLTISGGRMQGAYRGVQVSASSTATRVAIGGGLRIRGVSDVPIYLGHDDDVNDRIGTVLTDSSATVASATTIAPPLGTDLFTISGTTNIQNIDDNVSGGRVNFDGRVIKLVFAGILDVVHSTGNILLKAGSNLTTAAGTTLQLMYDSAGNVWREI